MGRPLRIHRPYAIYHVMLRGNNGNPIFFSDRDRQRMHFLMREGVDRFSIRLHAFCFMSNHIHLAVQVSDVSLSHVIQNLSFRYVQGLNRQTKTKGHLFQGRFKSLLVEGGHYFRELIRYIHLNPVRAGLVDDPIKYQWSSHQAYMQTRESPWLTRDPMLNAFGNTFEEKTSNYNGYILAGIGQKQNIDFQLGCKEGIIGSNEFIGEVLKSIEFENSNLPPISLQDLISEICIQYQIKPELLSQTGKERKSSHVRALLALTVRRSKHLSLESLSQILQRDASGLSRLANRLELECANDEMIACEVANLQRWIESYQTDEDEF